MSIRHLVGSVFVHPVFDYALIGGGLSLVVTAIVVASPDLGFSSTAAFPFVVLASNAAHFASSTVRLYTKPGSFDTWPFLTLAFPIVALGVLTVCMFQAGNLGPHLQSLYLTWSPYHYAAQAYGLAVMYSYRSGCRIGEADKRWLWWVALLPFFYNALTAPGVGLNWLAPASFLEQPVVRQALPHVALVLSVGAIALPVLLFAKIWRSASVPMPLFGLLAIVANGIWFLVLAPLDAFVYATIFHGIQYLAIVIVFHVKDQLSRPENRHGAAHHVLWFYGASLLLAYGLFNCLPLAYVASGFGRLESVLLVVAAINIHHFIVDAFIWRLRKDTSNRRVIESGLPAEA
jgi:hypothetical protein